MHDDKPDSNSEIIDIEKLQKQPKQAQQPSPASVKKPDFWFSRATNEIRESGENRPLGASVPATKEPSGHTNSSLPRQSKNQQNFGQLEKKHLEFLSSQFKELHEQNQQQLKQIGFFNEATNGKQLLFPSQSTDEVMTKTTINNTSPMPTQSMLPLKINNEELLSYLLSESCAKPENDIECKR